MISAPVPAPVVAFEEFGVPQEAPFFGEEELVANAVEVRRTEFTTARRCARRALAALGHAPAPLRPGPHRDPAPGRCRPGQRHQAVAQGVRERHLVAVPAVSPSTAHCRSLWFTCRETPESSRLRGRNC